MKYREFVDEKMLRFFNDADEKVIADMSVVIDIGLNHEQQHQELILTDIKHVFSVNPLHPVFREREITKSSDPGAIEWITFEKGIYDVGYKGYNFFMIMKNLCIKYICKILNSPHV
ncbi:MAG: hypothetical protein F9K45_08120 [Melioribacteraceae bacterium]|nr:MAG: hypothetical protein F9K45_08120 [Melioribacteraceae bacterium]